MNNEKKFLELIKSLENDKKLFFAGILHSEKEFFDCVKKLQTYIPRIKDLKIKEKVENFVSSIINNKNYRITLETIDQKEKKQRDFELFKQKLEEKKELEKQQKIRRIQNITNAISNIKKSFREQDLEMAVDLWSEYEREIYECDHNFYNFVSQNADLLNCLLKKKIKKLVHFTNIKNLESILKIGLLPRKELEDKNISFNYTDSQRYEGRKDCTSLSIEYPNYKMLKFKKDQYNDIYAILVLNATSILLNKYKKYYLYINAANTNATYWLTLEELTKNRYFSEMFKSKVEDKKNIYERNEKLPSYITTHPQAEILFNGPISPSNILEVHFENSRDYDSFMNICNIDKSSLDIDFIVSDFYFKNREEIEGEER